MIALHNIMKTLEIIYMQLWSLCVSYPNQHVRLYVRYIRFATVYVDSKSELIKDDNITMNQAK